MGLNGWTISACIAVACGVSGAQAEPVAPSPSTPIPVPQVQSARIELKTGDKIHGVVLSHEGPLVLEHSILGRLTLPADSIAQVTFLDPPPPAPAPQPVSGESPTVEVVIEVSGGPPITGPTAPQIDPTKPGFLDNWKLTFETGLTGTTGNLEQQSVRIRITGARTEPGMSTTTAVQWVHQQTEGEATQNNVQLDVRNDWPSSQHAGFGWYIAGTGEYNEFAPWDFRVSSNGGLSYDVATEPDLTIVARTGFGGSTEFGPLESAPRAEFWPGVDVEYRLDNRNKVGLSIIGSLNVEDIEASRATMKGWYETVIDPESQMSLRIGVEDRYESSPGLGREEHQVDYYALIVFKF